MLKDRFAKRRIGLIVQGGGGIVQNQNFRIARQAREMSRRWR